MKKKLHEQIKELEDQGYEVDIEHYRNFDIHIDPETGIETEKLSPRGGLTRVAIYKNDLLVVFADAICSEYDNYNRKLGGLIALGRAKKNLHQVKYGYNWISKEANVEAFND